jgi:hypothetical protein
VARNDTAPVAGSSRVATLATGRGGTGQTAGANRAALTRPRGGAGPGRGRAEAGFGGGLALAALVRVDPSGEESEDLMLRGAGEGPDPGGAHGEPGATDRRSHE